MKSLVFFFLHSMQRKETYWTYRSIVWAAKRGVLRQAGGQANGILCCVFFLCNHRVHWVKRRRYLEPYMVRWIRGYFILRGVGCYLGFLSVSKRQILGGVGISVIVF